MPFFPVYVIHNVYIADIFTVFFFMSQYTLQ